MGWKKKYIEKLRGRDGRFRIANFLPPGALPPVNEPPRAPVENQQPPNISQSSDGGNRPVIHSANPPLPPPPGPWHFKGNKRAQYNQSVSPTEKQRIDEIQGDYRDFMNFYRDQNQSGRGTYGQKRIADINDDIKDSHELGRVTAGSYHPYFNYAQNALHSSQKPWYQRAEKYMNPYINEVVNRIAEEGKKTFDEGIMPSLDAKFIKLGQHGSSRHATLAKRAGDSLQKEIMAQQQRALAQHYNEAANIHSADQARRLQAGKDMANVGLLEQAGNLADIGMLENQGKYLQSQEQARLEMAYQDYLRQKYEPLDMLERELLMYKGIPRNTTTMTYEQTAPTPHLNTAGQLANLGYGLLGMNMIRGMGKRRGGPVRRRY